MNYTCLKCKKLFIHKGDFNKHISRKISCIPNKDMIFSMLIKMQQLNNKIEKMQEKNKTHDEEIQNLKDENQLMRMKIVRLETLAQNKSILVDNSTKIDNRIDNRIDNSIKIVNFGDEDLSEILEILKNNPSQVITESSSESLVKCLAVIHCSENSKQNHNIKYDKTLSRNGLRVHYDGDWCSKHPKFIVKNTSICQKAEDLYDDNPSKYLDFNADIRKLISLNLLNGMPMTPHKKKSIDDASRKLLIYFKNLSV